MGNAADLRQTRATQSLVGTIAWSLRHPSLLAREIAWRWLFGIPAMWIVLAQAMRIYDTIPPGTLTRLQAAQYDPVQASAILEVMAETLVPAALSVLAWLLPSLVVAWAVVSGVGRWLVVRRLATLRPELELLASRPHVAAQLVLFQAARIGGLLLAFATAFLCMRAGSNLAFAEMQNPNLVLYFSVVIVSVLGTFTAWALLSWAVNVAPLLLLREGGTVWQASARSIRLSRKTRGKLMEINLVLGIVKLAMLVLAMVFSAIPLPFETATTPQQLHVWWIIVTVLYLAANALFQVVRLVATLEALQRTSSSDGVRAIIR